MLNHFSPRLTTAITLTALLVGCGGSADNTLESEVEVGTDSSTETGTIVINEIVAKAADGGNDWIELYVTEGTVDLTTYTIVDNDLEHTPQALPAISISSGEYLWLEAIDEEDAATATGYYVTFKLGSEDSVTLYNNAEIVDTISWTDGEAAEGNSYGRLPNGLGEPQTLTPTPEETNAAEDDSDSTPTDTIVNENAKLRINEIVAKSADGEYDWIELYVNGDDSVFLGDYSLSDEDSALQSLPAITLNPGEYYRLAASKDTVENIESVAFGLGSSDTVNLYLNDDLIDQLSWKKEQALINYSYGRYPDGSDASFTLVPTALETNVIAEKNQLLINEVVANDVSDGDDWFELYNNTSNSISLADYSIIDESDDIEAVSLPDIILPAGEFIVIYATKDSLDINYVPFNLGNSDELSLRLNDEVIDYIDWDDSDVIKGYSYGLTSDASWTADTLTPTLGATNQAVTVFDTSVVESIYIDIDESEWSDLLQNALDEEYHPASIAFKGVTLDKVAIRTKGNSSLSGVYQMGSERYSFKIDLNEYVDDQKLLGLKKFTLHNSYKDPSYMREPLAYALMSEMGIPSPKNSYVNLYINGQLHGLYLMVEAIDGEFLEDNFANSSGDLYKPDGVGSDLQWISDAFDDYTDVSLKSNEDSSDNGAFMNFIDTLNNADDLSSVNVDNILRYMAVSVALSNLDGVFSILPWDFNESFGTFKMDCNQNDLRNLTIDEPTSGALSERPLIAKIFSQQEHLDNYHYYLQTLINSSLSDDEFRARVNNIADLIRDHVAADPTAFFSLSNFNTSLTSDIGEVYGLTSFMAVRTANIQQQLDGTISASGDGSGYCSGGSAIPGGPPR
ncbi:CotH kinase family protein [Gilvimarinus polysaccharolyticus]|uniref:CotH kinase family protein n=1 Tax=Gilvimarinus polysaccharolyticus TaxID=863921 RepID=UPI0006734648|nr:CotH kinase family protein [Gilvimarinus polysaccharolyticus]